MSPAGAPSAGHAEGVDEGTATHLTLEELRDGLDEIRRSPADDGRIELIVGRPDVDERELLAEADLDLVTGLVGDTWSVRGSSSTPDGSSNPEKQITIMNARASGLIAVDPDRRPLTGDQLHLDLDISHANLPTGTRLGIGTAMIEITEPPHRGCAKFSARFGPDALRFVQSDEGRALRLRGVHAKVVVAGTVRVGDAVRKVR